jgi:serine/threonine protein kinase
VSQQRGGMEWQLSYRAKGASAAIYLGTPLRPSHTVAIKVALDGDRPIDGELVREAELMQLVASSHPEAVCRVYHQPAAGDAPPVFLAMTKVDCDFEELCRLHKPSPSALCEGLLLTFYALRSVHQSGVLHRDVKLNNIGFRISDAVRHPRSSSSSSPVFVGADGVHGVVDSRVSACMLDFGESVPLRIGHQGPTDYGRCKSKYASVARHECREQGFKDDLEMMVYAFLEHFLRCFDGGGLPWSKYCEEMRQRNDVEQRRMHDQFQETLVEKKLSLRRSADGEPTVAALVAVLKALDETHAREAPPYDAIENAIKRAWRHEALRTSASSLSLFAHVQQRAD